MRLKHIYIIGLLALCGASCVGSHAAQISEPVYIRKQLGSTSQDGSVLFLLHGYGSNERDLLGLTAMFPNSGDVVALRAPIELRAGAYCWFPIQGHTNGSTPDTMLYHLAGNQLQEWIDWIVVKENLVGKKIFIAGFSQGAMMCYEMARRKANSFAGIIGFSGSAKALNHLSETSNCGADMLMTHGTANEVLTYASGQEAKTKLEKCGAQVEFFTFGGGHQITDEAAEKARVWLKSRW